MGLLQWSWFLLIALHQASCARLKARFCSDLKIIGGYEITIKEAPFFASVVEYKDNEDEDFDVLCSGTIIHERFVLTSASCFVQHENTNKSVHVGSKDFDNGLYIKVEKQICHENYDEENLNNDICIFKLTGPVPFGWRIKTTLPDKNLVLKEGTLVNITGFGATHNYLNVDWILRQATVPVLSQECCDDVYEDFNDKQICAGSRRRDFCKGDNGGPLTYKNILVGIISGPGECGKNPGAYTRVSSYVDWIDEIIKKNL